MNLKKHLLLFGVLALFSIQLCNSELFTALAEMEELLETEAVLIGNLESYIIAQDHKLTYLRQWVIKRNISLFSFHPTVFDLILFVDNRRIAEYQKEHSEAAADISAYLSNPINAYLLTKRLTSDWKTIEDVMTYDVGAGKLQCGFILDKCSGIGFVMRLMWSLEKEIQTFRKCTENFLLMLITINQSRNNF